MISSLKYKNYNNNETLMWLKLLTELILTTKPPSYMNVDSLKSHTTDTTEKNTRQNSIYIISRFITSK